MEIKKVQIGMPLSTPTIKPAAPIGVTPAQVKSSVPVGVTPADNTIKPTTVASQFVVQQPQQSKPIISQPINTIKATAEVKEINDAELEEENEAEEEADADKNKDDKGSKNKNKDSSKSKAKNAKKEEEYKGPRKVVVYGNELFVENDPSVTLDAIRQRIVDDYQYTEFSSERTKMSIDSKTGIVVPVISFEKRG